MKVEFEITDDNISAAIANAFKSPSYRQNAPVQDAINKVVEAEIKNMVESGVFKERLVAKIHEQVNELAARRIMTLGSQFIREQVKQMSEAGEFEAFIKAAIEKQAKSA